MNPIFIGTGFYSSAEDHPRKLDFFKTWLLNNPSFPTVVIDNSALGLGPEPSFAAYGADLRIIRVRKNLGHMSAPLVPSRLLGGTLSWILPALVAYSENCDYIYKEQDCLAFGNWIPEVRQGRASFGNHATMDCEQSLVYIARDFIPDFLAAYMAIPESDAQVLGETKYKLIEAQFPGQIARHALQPGRGRPLPLDFRGPWTAQQFTAAELAALKAAGWV